MLLLFAAIFIYLTVLLSSIFQWLQSSEEQRLRKSVSDISNEIERHESAGEIVKQVECERCRLKEDCTLDYISSVRVSHLGFWVCGLCSEAVKGKLEKAPKMAMQEALSSHKDFCQEFNNTCTGLQQCTQKRSLSELSRTTSCMPRIDLEQ